MSIFQTINHEKNELVPFETLLREVSEQEGISFSEACAVMAREAAWHLEDIPFYEPFYLYDYDVIEGFIKNDEFSKNSLEFLKSMAYGVVYEQDPNPEAENYYSPIYESGTCYRPFYFKGTEISISFMDSGVKLPPCLEKYRRNAERWMKNKNDKRKEKIANEGVKEKTKQEIENEIKTLQNEVEKLTALLPPMLGTYRSDDPLLIAIQLRKTEWANYDEDDRKTVPSQEALVAQLKSQYKEYGMPDAQARAIEKVACPIKRK
ncbi:hypothetical protein V5038_14130 [Enterobacter ludwigii]|uniref:hypothetical protein n=1 Tax=Enterobacter ludwigii TaxID=299767 RepID=UPI0031732B9E